MNKNVLIHNCLFYSCRMLKEWPNTYAMTKAIAEGEILTYGKGLPIGVIRPSMSKYLFYLSILSMYYDVAAQPV